ncbi:hypothetical protein O181_023630 [Austropuccinia psidii MF-1]|uniref:Uncharacterized protein n=1 Tax=Austropuccinia psidii MF-1 TaxID=1389203 RepID=A0A9Q3CJG2_9BASI|nr:hypothetical protein [Austropuccinia psidii MF-1]
MVNWGHFGFRALIGPFWSVGGFGVLQSVVYFPWAVGGMPQINTEGIVKRIRQILNDPPDPDAEGSDELDGKEVEEIPKSSHASTPRTFQPTLATIPNAIPPASPHSSHTRPSLNTPVRPSNIQQSRNSPIVNPQQLQPVASTSRRREEFSPFPFPAAQVFQHRDRWPIRVAREDLNMASDNQDSVGRCIQGEELTFITSSPHQAPGEIKLLRYLDQDCLDTMRGNP